MRAQDIMTAPVITASSESTVREIAALLLEKRISAVPILEDNRRLVGIVSESDLMGRPELGVEIRRPWWLTLFAEGSRAADYIKSHGIHARDVMTKNLVTISPETRIADIVASLERHHIRRVPVIDEGKLVGIVSRTDLLRGLTEVTPPPAVSTDDRKIRSALMDAFKEAGVETHLISMAARDGSVKLVGTVRSQVEKDAIRVAIDNVAGIKGVDDEVAVIPLAFHP
ncbi:MAG: CBS domain-containing protein [Alphaproteobacteria bacterium]